MTDHKDNKLDIHIFLEMVNDSTPIEIENLETIQR